MRWNCSVAPGHSSQKKTFAMAFAQNITFFVTEYVLPMMISLFR